METGSRLLSSLASAALFLAVVPEGGHADPSTASLTIQPIDVCDLAGNCAVAPNDTTFFPQLQALLTAVWAQAGIAPVMLPPETLPIQQTGTGATQVGLITGVDLNQPIDGFRLLTRLPQYNPSPYHNPNTINLYVVDTLSQPGQTVRGTSYVNGNGIILSSIDSLFDTGGHELGHNLGLDHPTFGNNPQDPNNVLSAGGIRISPSPGDFANIAPNGMNLDKLNTTQIPRTQQPLFTVDLGRATVTPLTGDSCPFGTCFNASFLGPPPTTTETLNSIVFKYAPNDEFLPDSFQAFQPPPGTGFPPADVNGIYTTVSTPSGPVEILTITFQPGTTFGQGDSFDFSTFDSEEPSNPVSVIFNFRDGFSSQAGYDAVTGADSGFGSFGFVGTPNYYVPGTCPNDDCTMLPPLFGSPPSTEVIETDVVPEPSSLVVLGPGLVLLWALRRRSSVRRPRFAGTRLN